MKYLTIMLFVIVLSSCSKTLYYAWEREGGAYCTLEVQKHKVIYRGSAAEYMIHRKNNVYIYI